MESDSPKIDFCTRCGEYLRPDVSFCPKCGAAIPGRAPYQGAAPVVAATKKPTWAGVLLILAGLIGFAMTAFLLLNKDLIIEQVNQMYGGPVPGAETTLDFLAGYWVIAGIVSIIGGVSALRRRSYALSLVGAFLGATTLGVFLFEGTIMAVIALILLVLSKQEFR
jgi:hypothetical protein